MRGDDRLDAALDRVFVANVEGRGVGDTAVVADLVGHREQLAGAAPDQHDGRAEGGELVGGATPDARAAAGDDDDLAGEQARREDRSIASWCRGHADSS